MVHLKNRSDEEITAFMAVFKTGFPEASVVLVPTTYNHIMEEELAVSGPASSSTPATCSVPPASRWNSRRSLSFRGTALRK
jgi:hypothetical protein